MGFSGFSVGFVGLGYKAAKGVPEVEAPPPASRKLPQMTVMSVITVMILRKTLR
jgi:hypothetical protein